MPDAPDTSRPSPLEHAIFEAVERSGLTPLDHPLVTTVAIIDSEDLLREDLFR